MSAASLVTIATGLSAGTTLVTYTALAAVVAGLALVRSFAGSLGAAFATFVLATAFVLLITTFVLVAAFVHLLAAGHLLTTGARAFLTSTALSIRSAVASSIAATAILAGTKFLLSTGTVGLITALLGFLAVGASLAIAGTFLYFLLCTVIYFAIKRRRLEKDNMLIFITCLAGAVVNWLAPGNLLGRVVDNSGVVDMKAVTGHAFEHYIYTLRWLFASRNYLVLIVSLVVVGYLIYDKIVLCKGAWIVIGVMFFAAPLITVFAVTLGYGMEQVPNRCFFIVVMAMTAAFDNLALFIGWLLGRTLKGHKKMSVLAVLYAIIFVCFIATPFSPGKYCVVMLNRQLYSGELQKNYIETKKFTDSLLNMKDKDVKVDVPTNPETIGNFYSFFLLDDPDSGINRDVAKVYGLSSISNIREE